jgi:hypothetical protein
MPTQLPDEFDGPLDYDELIEMLGRVEGEPVFIHMGWGRGRRREVYTLALVGTLRRIPLDTFGEDPSGGDEVHFGVGSGDALPSGGTVVLARSRVRAARLLTIDGHDFFTFSIETDAGPVTIAAEAWGP